MRTRNGFTVTELAVLVTAVSALCAMATFREGGLIGGGVFASGMLLCGHLLAKKRGLRAAAAALLVASVAAAAWTAKGCKDSLASHARAAAR